jgi:hypothetical protein
MDCLFVGVSGCYFVGREEREWGTHVGGNNDVVAEIAPESGLAPVLGRGAVAHDNICVEAEGGV